MKLTALSLAVVCTAGVSLPAFADSRAETDALKQQMAETQRQLEQMMAMQKKLQAKIEALQTSTAAKPAAQPAATFSNVQIPAPRGTTTPDISAVPATVRTSTAGVNNLPPSQLGSTLSARVNGVDIGLYGFVDVSVDSASNGQRHFSQVSGNESFLGVAGGMDLWSPQWRAIFQLETLADFSATPSVASSLGSRNSFAGLQTPFGKVAFGKNTTPYQRSTALYDPLAGSLGDYRSIMGNSAGEGRAEFAERMPHAVFYDSPSFAGFTFNALFSPGQKLNDLNPGVANNAFAQGELVCAGTQQPSLNGATPNAGVCNDGSYKNVYSLAVSYGQGPLHVTGAYEVHKDTDRSSDAHGLIADEDAAKVGVSYHFGFGNQLSAIWETFHRYGVPSAYNERQRDGFYISDVQDIGHGFDLVAAWAHAGQTPGSPKFPGLNDEADMYTGGVKYHYNDRLTLYLMGAEIKQGPGAHYGLGAGEAHGAMDLSPRTAGGGPLPGKTLEAVSGGLQYQF